MGKPGNLVWFKIIEISLRVFVFVKKKKRMLFRAEFRILLKKVRNEYLPAGMNADGK